MSHSGDPRDEPHPGPEDPAHAGATHPTPHAGQHPHPERPAPRAGKVWVVIGVLLGVVLLLIIGGLVLVAITGEGDRGLGRGGQSEVAAEPNGAATVADGERQVTERPLDELLDTVVLGTDFELAPGGWSPHEDAVSRGAREALTGLYTDGERQVLTTAAAFDTIASHDAYAESLVEEQPSQDLTSEGTVYSDDTGRYWSFEHEDGSATIIWRTDNGVVLSVAGETAAAEEVFANLTI